MPGLHGGTPEGEQVERPEQFGLRMRWLKDGYLGVQRVSPDYPSGRILPVDKDWLRLEAGRWYTIEQEVQLNSPSAADGYVRIWVNGELRFRDHDIVLRSSPTTQFFGVHADTHYAGRSMHWQPAPSTTEIHLTPFVMRWN